VDICLRDHVSLTRVVVAAVVVMVMVVVVVFVVVKACSNSDWLGLAPPPPSCNVSNSHRGATSASNCWGVIGQRRPRPEVCRWVRYNQ